MKVLQKSASHTNTARNERNLSRCLPLFTSGRARILDNKRLINQFATLERNTSSIGRDRVNHPIGGHDDCANATALAMVLAAQPVYAPPQPCFGTYGWGAGWNGAYFVGGGDGSAGSTYASAPAAWWAARGVYHPSDRDRWIKEGVIKPAAEEKSK